MPVDVSDHQVANWLRQVDDSDVPVGNSGNRVINFPTGLDGWHQIGAVAEQRVSRRLRLPANQDRLVSHRTLRWSAGLQSGARMDGKVRAELEFGAPRASLSPRLRLKWRLLRLLQLLDQPLGPLRVWVSLV